MALNRCGSPVTYGSPGEAIIRMHGITKVFHTASGDVTVLRDIHVDVRQGEFVSVVGRSGSGKSTLVNMLTGIDHPTSGTIQVGGGQQQSAAVARAVANDPPILIADEPTGNLDSHTAKQVMDIFEELVTQGKTILMVTHDRTLAAHTSRILLISDGELIKESSPQTELLRVAGVTL